MAVRSKGWVEINPEDGARLNIKEKEIITIRSAQGEIASEVVFSFSLLPHSAFHLPRNPEFLFTPPL